MDLDKIVDNLCQSFSESFYNLTGYKPSWYIKSETKIDRRSSYKYYIYLPYQTDLELITILNRFIDTENNQYRIHHTQFIPLRLKIEFDRIISDQYMVSFHVLDRLKIIYDLIGSIKTTTRKTEHELILSFSPIVVYHKDDPDSPSYVFDTTKETFKPNTIYKKDPNPIPVKFLQTLDQIPYINTLLHTLIETNDVEVIFAINSYDTDYKTMAFMFQINDPDVLEKFYNLWVNWQILLDMKEK